MRIPIRTNGTSKNTKGTSRGLVDSRKIPRAVATPVIPTNVFILLFIGPIICSYYKNMHSSYCSAYLY